MITKLDFVAVPSQDAERSRLFYGETLGLRRDEHGEHEFWAGDTCLAHLGAGAPRHDVHTSEERPPGAARDDVAKARAELEAKGVEFAGDTFDTGVCHMALFTDPDGNDLMLHHRYVPYA